MQGLQQTNLQGMLEDYNNDDADAAYKVLQLKAPSDFDKDIPPLDKLGGFLLFIINNDEAKQQLESCRCLDQA